jgi:hypothetical protein
MGWCRPERPRSAQRGEILVLILAVTRFWDDQDSRIEEVIALTSEYATAKSAYEEAIKRRPGRLITLRQKARVIQSTRKI